MEADVAEAVGELRNFMFERVYLRPEGEEHRRRAMQIVEDLVRYYQANQSEIPEALPVDRPAWRGRVDYVAGMTDRFRPPPPRGALRVAHAHTGDPGGRFGYPVVAGVAS